MKHLSTICAVILLLYCAAPAPATAQKGDFDFKIKKVLLDETNESVTYYTSVAGRARTVSYALVDKEHVQMSVTDGRGKTLLRVRMSDKEARGQAGRERFRARPGAQIELAEVVDARTAWVVKHDLIRRSSISLKQLLPFLQGDEDDESVQSGFLVGVGAIFLDIIWDWWNGGSGGNCANPGQQTMCTEQDVNGNMNTIVYTCDCGTPICAQQSISVEVQVAAQNATTGEISSQTEVRNFTKCVCYCMEMTSFPDN